MLKKLFIFWVILVPNLLVGCLITAEFRIGAFKPTSDYFRNIYKNGLTEFEVESNLRLYENITAFVNYNSIFKKESSLALYDDKRLSLISFGVKFRFEAVSRIFLYTGLGANHALKHNHPNSWGVVFKNGILLCASNYFFIDIFVDYYHNQTCIDSACPNISGLRAGAGIGVGF